MFRIPRLILILCVASIAPLAAEVETESTAAGDDGLRLPENLKCEFDFEQNTVKCDFTIPMEEQRFLLDHCNEDHSLCVQATINFQDQSEPTITDTTKEEAATKDQTVEPPSTWYRSLDGDYEKALHFRDMADEYLNSAGQNLVDGWNQDTKQAERSLLEALMVYEDIRAAETRMLEGGPSTDALVGIADIHFHLGQIYHMDPERHKQALHHYRNAETIFSTVLTQDSGLADYKFTRAENCLRMGVLLLDSNAMGEGFLEEEILVAEGYTRDLGMMMRNTGDVQAALEAFSKAVDILIEYLDPNVYRLMPLDKIQVQSLLATARQNRATALLLLDKKEEAAEASEEAIKIYRSIYKKMPVGSMEYEDMIVGMAEVQLSLSDVYLQMGQYDKSKAAYHDTMMWYKTHGIESPAGELPPIDLEETMTAYENALEEYHRLMGDTPELKIKEDIGEAVYEPDHGHEGDLHAGLGSIHLANDEIALAINHFTLAIQLYNEAATVEDRAIADVRLSMASAFFRDGDYKSSEIHYREALDIFERVVPEGENPLLGLMPMLDSSTVIRDLSEADDAEGEQNTEGEKESHQKFIDLDSYRQSIMNGTLAGGASDEL